MLNFIVLVFNLISSFDYAINYSPKVRVRLEYAIFSWIFWSLFEGSSDDKRSKKMEEQKKKCLVWEIYGNYFLSLENSVQRRGNE